MNKKWMRKNKGITRLKLIIMPKKGPLILNIRFHLNSFLKDINSKELVIPKVTKNYNKNYLASIQYILLAARSRVRPFGQAPFL